MGICPGQAPMTVSSFCRFRVKTDPSEEDSASCKVVAGLIQSLIAVRSANDAFSSKPSLRQPLKTFQKELMLIFRYSGDLGNNI